VSRLPFASCSTRYSRISRVLRHLLISVVIALACPALPSVAQVPFDDAIQVVAGESHSCALRANGTVWCWGDNAYGRLGDGTTTSRQSGVQVQNLINAVEITAGAIHNCALTSLGSVVCWGGNHFGQLGDGTTTSRSLPTTVVGLTSGVTSLSAGRHHSCAVVSGIAKCWGNNTYGVLGDGTTTSRRTPTDVIGLGSNVASISAGNNHTCALDAARRLLCWGYNSDGQLGDGSTENRLTPVFTNGLDPGVLSMSTGSNRSCAVSGDGLMHCWGNNASGQIGDGTTTDRTSPAQVIGIEDVSLITLGSDHTCATSAAGTFCWGANEYGRLGDGSTSQRNSPTPVLGENSDVIAIAAGGRHSCLVAADHRVRCWGDGRVGQLGDDVVYQFASPTPVTGLDADMVDIASGAGHSCALSNTGEVRCWGSNVWGQLGDGTLENRTTPVAVNGLPSGVLTVTAGALHTCAVLNGGAAYCWGNDSSGQLGGGNSGAWRTTPSPVLGLESNVADLYAGYAHTCARMTDNSVYCWGNNQGGQLGDGTYEYRSSPVAVVGLDEGAVTLAVGSLHSCALTTLGSVKCWGENWRGELGDGSTTARPVATPVIGLSAAAIAIAAGDGHTCATLSNGAVMCWGSNEYGQIGDGNISMMPVVSPTNVAGLAVADWELTAGNWHTCAYSSAGTFCWGLGGEGQLGYGGFGTYLTPVGVSAPSFVAQSMSAGYQHTCAITSGGEVNCWGSNYSGEAGLGRRSFRSLPLDAVFTVSSPVFSNGFE